MTSAPIINNYTVIKNKSLKALPLSLYLGCGDSVLQWKALLASSFFSCIQSVLFSASSFFSSQIESAYSTRRLGSSLRIYCFIMILSTTFKSVLCSTNVYVLLKCIIFGRHIVVHNNYLSCLTIIQTVFLKVQSV